MGAQIQDGPTDSSRGMRRAPRQTWLARLLWRLLGTDDSIVASSAYRDKLARVGLGFAMVLTTALAFCAALTFIFTLRTEWTDVSTGFGVGVALLYALAVYFFDLSIVARTSVSWLQGVARVALAIFLSVVISGQLNMMLHRDLLLAKFGDYLMHVELPPIERDLADAQQRQADALTAQKSLLAEAAALQRQRVEWAGDDVHLRGEAARIGQKLASVREAQQTLNCVMPAEAKGERWEKTCPLNASNPYLAPLRLESTGIRGPRTACGPTGGSLVCRMDRALARMEPEEKELNAAYLAITQRLDKGYRQERITNIDRMLEVLNRSVQVAIEQQEIQRGRIQEADRKVVLLRERASASATELHSTMWQIMLGTWQGAAVDPEVKFWMWLMLGLVFGADLFVLISKALWSSPGYDAGLNYSESLQKLRTMLLAARTRGRLPPRTEVEEQAAALGLNERALES